MDFSVKPLSLYFIMVDFEIYYLISYVCKCILELTYTYGMYNILCKQKSGAKDFERKTKGISFVTRKQGRYEDLLKGKVDVDFVARLERKNDSHTISNKTFDFTKNTILQLIQDGYEETKEQMKQLRLEPWKNRCR